MVVVCKYDCFYSVGEGGGWWCGDVVANSVNIMQRDYTPCNLIAAFCYLL